MQFNQVIKFSNEIWVPITTDIVDNVAPIYKISNYGLVYSKTTNQIMSRSIDKDGYYHITLRTTKPPGNGKEYATSKSIARLVLMTFAPIDHPELYEAHHKNRNTLDNYIGNLEWITPEEHQILTKSTWPRGIDAKLNGEGGSNVTLTRDQVIYLKTRVANGEYTSLRSLANELGIGETSVFNIAHGNQWVGYGPDIPKEDFRVSSGFTNDEIRSICNYFETHDICNRSIYPSVSYLLRQCYFDLGLDKKYGPDAEFKRKLMTNILKKSAKFVNRITCEYKYEYK